MLCFLQAPTLQELAKCSSPWQTTINSPAGDKHIKNIVYVNCYLIIRWRIDRAGDLYLVHFYMIHDVCVLGVDRKISVSIRIADEWMFTKREGEHSLLILWHALLTHLAKLCIWITQLINMFITFHEWPSTRSLDRYGQITVTPIESLGRLMSRLQILLR